MGFCVEKILDCRIIGKIVIFELGGNAFFLTCRWDERCNKGPRDFETTDNHSPEYDWGVDPHKLPLDSSKLLFIIKTTVGA